MMLLFLAQSVAAVPDPLAVVAIPLYSPLMITLVTGLIVTVISAIVGGIVAVITALRVTAVKDVQASTAQTILDVAKNTEAIKGHVNSERTAAEGRELMLRRENELLREMIADKRVTAALLAQAVASATGAAAGAGVPPIVVAVPIPPERREPNERASDREPLRVEVINEPLLTKPA